MLLTICILAASLSVDALGIGIAYGVRNIKVPIWSKIIICLFTIVITSISLLLGKWAAAWLGLSNGLARFLGAAILIFVGLFIIFQSFSQKKPKKTSKKQGDTTILNCFIASMGISIRIMRHTQSGDMDNSNTIDSQEAMYLGFALSIDSIGAGFGSAVSGLYTPMIPIAAALFQMLFLSAGILLGKKIQDTIHINSRIWTMLSGCMLIVLAIIRFLF